MSIQVHCVVIHFSQFHTPIKTLITYCHINVNPNVVYVAIITNNTVNLIFNSL